MLHCSGIRNPAALAGKWQNRMVTANGDGITIVSFPLIWLSRRIIVSGTIVNMTSRCRINVCDEVIWIRLNSPKILKPKNKLMGQRVMEKIDKTDTLRTILSGRKYTIDYSKGNIGGEGSKLSRCLLTFKTLLRNSINRMIMIRQKRSWTTGFITWVASICNRWIHKEAY